jgi:hypothetical protein
VLGADTVTFPVRDALDALPVQGRGSVLAVLLLSTATQAARNVYITAERSMSTAAHGLFVVRCGTHAERRERA